MSEDFEALSRALQIRIDEAFDIALDSRPSIGQSPVKSSKSTAANSELAGGFDIGKGDLIPLSLIPSALESLDLPPDDDEVLQVFQNAAGGWSASRTGEVSISREKEGRTITRKDWRAVCAVIIDDPEDEDVAGGFLVDREQTALAGVEDNPLQEEEIEDDEDDIDDEDKAYQESSLSSFSSGHVSDSASDEYTLESSSKAKSKSSRRKSERTPASTSFGTPTSRQTRASLDAFALFFPSLPPLTDADLSTKRLMFKDIVGVAAMLKEKIKAEEVEEMLSLFSTSPDKAMSFDDFTRMMVIAKLACPVRGKRALIHFSQPPASTLLNPHPPNTHYRITLSFRKRYDALPAVCLVSSTHVWRHTYQYSSTGQRMINRFGQ